MRALYVLAAVLLVLWIAAMAVKVTAGVIHLLLVGALLLVMINLLRGRRTV